MTETEKPKPFRGQIFLRKAGGFAICQGDGLALYINSDGTLVPKSQPGVCREPEMLLGLSQVVSEKLLQIFAEGADRFRAEIEFFESEEAADE